MKHLILKKVFNEPKMSYAGFCKYKNGGIHLAILSPPSGQGSISRKELVKVYNNLLKALSKEYIIIPEEYRNKSKRGRRFKKNGICKKSQ